MHPDIKLGSTQRPNDAARVVVFAGFLFAGVVGHNVIMLKHKKRFSHRGVKLPDSLLNAPQSMHWPFSTIGIGVLRRWHQYNAW